MNSHSSDNPITGPRVFKFRSRLQTVLIFGPLLIAICVLLGAFAIHRGSLIGGTIFIVLNVLWWGYGVVIATLGDSDLEIDNNGLSRRLLGYKYQSFAWDSVRLIRTSRVVVPREGTRRLAINIFANPAGRPKFFHANKMTVAQDMQESEELVGCLNSYVEKYQIKVTSKIDGAWHSASRVA